MERQIALLWQPCQTGARILRVFGDTPCPVLPGTVDGLPVTEIGPYCFSARDINVGGQFWSSDGQPATAWPHAICGNFLEAVTLPDSLRSMHNAAFYNCRSLQLVSVGAGPLDLGSDLFTNCRSLQLFLVRAQPLAMTGLRRLLAAVPADIAVEFIPDSQTAARLFFPEYSEYLDENTPAHIFNHSIEGIGYRYRQCFVQDVLQFAEYDDAFAQADAEESSIGLCRIALDRLLFPYALAPESRTRYEGICAPIPPMPAPHRSLPVKRTRCKYWRTCCQKRIAAPPPWPAGAPVGAQAPHCCWRGLAHPPAVARRSGTALTTWTIRRSICKVPTPLQTAFHMDF